MPTGAVAALHALADARSRGLDDDEILATLPVVLALVPPRVGPLVPLPPVPKALPPVPEGDVPLLVARESLRLRARWLQELTARAAWEIGRRLAETGELASPDAVRHLTLDQLDEVLRGGRPAATIVMADAPAVAPEPLPALFRLGAGGEVVPVASRGRKAAARGAGGGRGSGPVHHGTDAPAGSVLVVRTLSPDLAPLLPRLRGLVAETGSVLSHLAILARESGVPVVVGRLRRHRPVPRRHDRQRRRSHRRRQRPADPGRSIVMNGRTIARWIAVLTLLGAGITMLRELADWEWHRALVAGTFTLIAEVALATSLILDRLAKMPSAAGRRPAPPSARSASRRASMARGSSATTSPGCATRRGSACSCRC